MTIGLARYGCIGAAVLATIAGCGSSSSISVPGDTWSVASDLTNGGWEIELLTADVELQRSFEEERGFFMNLEGSPVVWLKKVDGREDYEPMLWLVDSSSNRIPLQYIRSSSQGSTYLGAALLPAPSLSQTATALELQIRDQIVARWQLDAADYSPPAHWPPVSQLGAEVTMSGVTFNLTPIKTLQAAGEVTASTWRFAEKVTDVEGTDQEFEYELRYSLWSDATVRTVDLGSPPDGPGGDPVSVGEFEADALCRLMKYSQAPFSADLTLDQGLYFNMVAELEASQRVGLQMELGGGSFDVYGFATDERAAGQNNAALWIKVRQRESTALGYTNEFRSGWVMLLIEGASIGDKMDQYDLEDGATMLVFNSSRKEDGWRDSPLAIMGTARSIADYQEIVVQLPVSVLMPARQDPSVSQNEEIP